MCAANGWSEGSEGGGGICDQECGIRGGADGGGAGEGGGDGGGGDGGGEGGEGGRDGLVGGHTGGDGGMDPMATRCTCARASLRSERTSWPTMRLVVPAKSTAAPTAIAPPRSASMAVVGTAALPLLSYGRSEMQMRAGALLFVVSIPYKQRVTHSEHTDY